MPYFQHLMNQLLPGSSPDSLASVQGQLLDRQFKDILTPGTVLYTQWCAQVDSVAVYLYDILLNDLRVLSREDPVYCQITMSYREACGLPALTVKENGPADFSGVWVFNEEKSSLDNNGASNLPCMLEIEQNKNELIIKRTHIVEFADNTITEEIFPLDGSEIHSEFRNSPKVTTVTLSEKRDTLYIDSKVTFTWDNRTSETITREIWTLEERGKVLSIHQYSNSFWSERNIILKFDTH